MAISPPPTSGKPTTKRQAHFHLMAQLKTARSSWEGPWKQLTDHFAPHSHEFDTSRSNQGDRQDQRIYNETGILSVRTAGAGMVSGMCNPAQRWIKFKVDDPALEGNHACDVWLDKAVDALLDELLKSNFYQAAEEDCESILTVGTCASLTLEQFRGAMFTFRTLPIGSYYAANGSGQRVTVLGRELQMTARQLLEEFGRANLSQAVRSALDVGNTEMTFDVSHIIQPNPAYDPAKLASNAKRFLEEYYEMGGTDDQREQPALLDAGYDENPAQVARWKTKGTDVWGRGPALDVLGSNMALQAYEYKIALAVDKMLDPPMNVPAGMQTQALSLIPGAMNYLTDGAGEEGLRPVYQIEFDIQKAQVKATELEKRVRRGLFEDLFLMLANDHSGKMTAREIVERHQEKMLVLGPVFMRMNQEYFSPRIDRCLGIMGRRGKLPPLPPELAGKQIKIEYLSVLAEAVRLQQNVALEQSTGFLLQIAAVNPEALDCVDLDELIRQHFAGSGSTPKVLRDIKAIEQIRERRSAAQQKEAMQVAAVEGAKAAKDLSQADTDGKNLLTDASAQMEEQEA